MAMTISLNFDQHEIEEIFREYVKMNYPDLVPGGILTNISEHDRGGSQFLSSITVICSKKADKVKSNIPEFGSKFGD